MHSLEQRYVFLYPLFGNILNLPLVSRLFFCSAVSSTAAFDDLHHLILLFGSAERSPTGLTMRSYDPPSSLRRHLPFNAIIPTSSSTGLFYHYPIISRSRTSCLSYPQCYGSFLSQENQSATSDFQATSIVLAPNIQETPKYLDGCSTNPIPHSHAPPLSLTPPIRFGFLSFLQEPVGIIGAARFGHHCIIRSPKSQLVVQLAVSNDVHSMLYAVFCAGRIC
ncbi:hypothetical protein B0H16DRAFT_1623673 [Mycena metata]|uniref:Uncharacterized protein n=1 Tax=Mycena metata TaxID=1033252 RepID=A0AAD7H5U2_9AGAR|nr:hypothetical protein B0H16DRAFT_1623673 [Mycena metata]